MISTEHKFTCIFFIQRLLILRFLLYTYVLYIVFEVNVGSYYNISVQTFRCHLRKPYCLADFYRYITFIFAFFCFKYDAYFNLKKNIWIQRKTDYKQVKRLHLHISSAPFGLFVTRDAYQTLFMLRIFFTFEKKLTIQLINS